jgi:hypothetical protein
MENISLPNLNAFIVRAKATTYVGSGEPAPSCRPGSHDLKFADGNWSYLDSYFGGRDFIGQEVVYYAGRPVWAMNYHGRILRDELITPAQVGGVIKASLSKMYAGSRFLGEFENQHEGFVYSDSNDGDTSCFRGRETIARGDQIAYELVYHGGLIKDE